jgi:hypothetical protein
MNNFIKKITFACIVSFAFGVILFPSRNVLAVPTGYPVFDASAVAQLTIISNSLSGTSPGAQQDNNFSKIQLAALKVILRQLTNSIVNWINTGFDGSPSFITNTEQFLLNTADVTVGDFLMNSDDLKFLCDPFKIQLKLALGLQYRPFSEKIECSFTSAVGNATTAMNDFLAGDFIGGGGWDSWLQITSVPQNNQMGAMLMAQGELDARIEEDKGRATLEAGWGKGFMSWKDCPDYNTAQSASAQAQKDASNSRIDKYATLTAQERGDDGCVIKTPGGVIANKIDWVDTSTLRELELADNFNSIISALANQAAVTALGALADGGLLGNTNADSNSDSYNEYMQYLSDLESSASSTTSGN